jgi:hypothetical protein
MFGYSESGNDQGIDGAVSVSSVGNMLHRMHLGGIGMTKRFCTFFKHNMLLFVTTSAPLNECAFR